MKQPPYSYRSECRICPNGKGEVGKIDPKMLPRNTTLIPILDLGETPLADTFVADQEAPEFTAPLRVGVCPICWCVQLMDIVAPNLLFGDDYAFFTGASPSSVNYFAEYAREIIARYPEKSRKVLEIASNDGTLLKHFQDAGCDVLGVEPTGNTAEVAGANGVPTEVQSFSFNTAMQLRKQYGKFSMVLANNVVAHVDTLHDFIGGVSDILTDDGVFIFEVQYFPHLLFQNAFDHVYHEHHSFFSLTALKTLLRLTWFTIIDVQEADTQGGSIRVFAQKDPWGITPPSESVRAMLSYEEELGMTDLDTYKGMQPRVEYTAIKLLRLLKTLKKAGKTIYGFGASAKGNTLLNYCGIGPELLDCVVDTTPWKIGKYTPGTHIPVVGPHDRPEPDFYLVLVHNYLPGILEREYRFRQKGGRFIVPVPVPVVI